MTSHSRVKQRSMLTGEKTTLSVTLYATGASFPVSDMGNP
jgi:hypothetical protein